MGVPFQKGNMIDKGWSYSTPPIGLTTPAHGSKEAKKPAYDAGTRSPTRQSANHR